MTYLAALFAVLIFEALDPTRAVPHWHEFVASIGGTIAGLFVGHFLRRIRPRNVRQRSPG